GLELSEEKTKITHVQEGYAFLGFNIRKYEDKLLIKPEKQNVLKYVSNLKEIIKKHSGSAGDLITKLNPKLKGWGNFYRHSVASKAFHYVDAQIFESLYAWAKKRHHNKSVSWIVETYFHKKGSHEWRF